VRVGAREFLIVGTAHISRESADLVREVIEREQPDCVCVELDAQRYEALSQKRSFRELDVLQLIRRKQLAALIANLLLASYQKKLGGALGILPGTELLAATEVAQRLGIEIALCDRDVRVTLRRAWASMGFFKKSTLVSNLALALFERPEVSEEDLRRLRDQDVLSELMRELGEAMPALKTALIDERDAYLAQRMREAPGERIVAVVGAGHVGGIRDALASSRQVDLAAIESIPPVPRIWKLVGWGIPALIVLSLLYIGVSKGPQVAGRNLLFWIVATGTPSSIGALLAGAHPITTISAFFAAPLTTLSPVIGIGHVCAFVQAYLRPPKVREFESLADDVAKPREWWRNRVLRVLLVFVLTTIGGIAGTYVGGYEIVSNLF
jgi:pheromone shutdown-related protein TraB